MSKKRKIDNVNANNNNQTHLFGPGFSGETYLLLKILSRKPDRDFYINNKSPPDQYSNSKIKIKENGVKVKPLNDYENATIVFDDVLSSSKSKYIDQFFKMVRDNDLDIYYLSQSFFELPEKSIRNKE